MLCELVGVRTKASQGFALYIVGLVDVVIVKLHFVHVVWLMDRAALAPSALCFLCFVVFRIFQTELALDSRHLLLDQVVDLLWLRKLLCLRTRSLSFWTCLLSLLLLALFALSFGFYPLCEVLHLETNIHLNVFECL